MKDFLIRSFIILGVGGFVLWNYNPQILKQLIEIISTASIQSITPKTETPVVETQSIRVEELQQLSQLTTAKLNLQLVIPTEQSRNFGGLEIGKTKVLYIAKTKVAAGIDLSKISESNIKYDEVSQTTTIRLPSPEILDVSLDTDRSKLYDASKTTILAPDTAQELIIEAQKKAILDSKKEACDSNLLKEANEAASSNLKLFFSKINGNNNSEVSVITTDPPSCK